MLEELSKFFGMDNHWAFIIFICNSRVFIYLYFGLYFCVFFSCFFRFFFYFLYFFLSNITFCVLAYKKSHSTVIQAHILLVFVKAVGGEVPVLWGL